ncbi:hypothetical protein J4G48_0028075 [Bradyrhizobium barranii subsp. apii]|uniref:hypothetical protein n=1 Tax=Bradyrhizobium barranii TaxID=2992140 RepID=UPI001AA1CFBA|nr:hypothetical protein [Bradyrhizobium barranii]UPT93242.1 hypothetical protein J4G48_0028075 [Bradyrhizobium barranii subsp. apii]
MALSIRFYLFAEDGLQSISQRVMMGLIRGKDAMCTFLHLYSPASTPADFQKAYKIRGKLVLPDRIELRRQPRYALILLRFFGPVLCFCVALLSGATRDSLHGRSDIVTFDVAWHLA